MAHLDRMLGALLEKRGEALVLVEGRAPAFLVSGVLRPVSQKNLERGQIATLLAELSSEIDAAQVARGERLSFAYRPGSGPTFRCDVDQQSGALQARLAPMAEEPAAAPPSADAEGATAPATDASAAAPGAASAGAPIDAMLRHMLAVRASDLHLSSGEVPMLRLDGEMVRVEGTTKSTPERVAELLRPIFPERNRREFEETHDTDFAHSIEGLARFRVNVFADRHGCGAVFRQIPSKIPSAEELGVPKSVLELCQLKKGLVLVTGPTGSGKSTTLAAMVDHINRTRSEHMITIEDPLEFVHANHKCLINQREVVTHTASFKRALRAALREDPDIVLVGEMRDLETIAIAIETAETGHLVFGTLHTNTAVSTVDRIIDQFPADQQAQIRTMLSEALRGVVSQMLLKKIGGGRVAALEVLVVTPAISNLIREGKSFQIPSLMQTGKKHGMVLLNDALLELVKTKKVDPNDAYRAALDKASLLTALRNQGIHLQVGE